jgi:hypothetical protein
MGARGWSQAWRAPLRDAIDFVRDKAEPLVDDDLPLIDDEAARARYLDEHSLSDGESRLRALRLCELGRYCQLMYTSCGWFFDEISGLEGTQILRYANRALELYEQLTGDDLEPQFLALLSKAKSNLPELADGAEVYRRLVVPSRVTHARLAAQEAILSLFVPRPRELDYGGFHVKRFGERRAGDARFGLITGRINLRWVPTGELHELSYAVLHVGAADVCCAVSATATVAREVSDEIWRQWPRQSIARLLRAIERGFGPAEYTVKDLLLEERHRVLREVYGDLLKGVSEEYARLYDNHRHTMHVLRDAGLPIPEPLKLAAESVLGARFEAEIARQRGSRDPARYRRAIKMAEDARERGLTLHHGQAEHAFADILCDLLASLKSAPSPERLRDALHFLALGRRLGIETVSPRAQEQLWELVSERELRAPELLTLATELGFAPLVAADADYAYTPSSRVMIN